MNFEWFLSVSLFFISMFSTPGPIIIVIITLSSQKGFLKTLHFIYGGIIGSILNFSIFLFLTTKMLHTYDFLQIIMKNLSLIYIFYLAYKILSSHHIQDNPKALKNFKDGLLIGFFNPKTYMTAVSTSSLFINLKSVHYLYDILLITIIVLIIMLIADILWAAFGSQILSKLSQNNLKLLNIFLVFVMVSTVLFSYFQ